eukprot:TRINITY_DN4376_c0_g2_i5.p1 TRINITY_DN4376_c0_g2~~TRINITY_DN4376_c0_g2_i5.p1  ORF type:complete len:983 (+),score=58.52 TRINITY_DN4376_c0_g2_i5:142-3090(+)
MASEKEQPAEVEHVRVRGYALWNLQFKALMIKNILLAWRNRASTFLQLFASFFFIFLIFAVNEALQAALSSHTEFKNVHTPPPVFVPGIRACEDAFYIKPPCYDFLYSGNQSEVVQSLARNISANNPGRPIDFATQVLGFATPADVDAWLLANPYKTTGVLHFAFTPTGALGYGLQTNSTVKSQRGQFEDATFDYQVPLQAAAEREIARYIAQDWSIQWTPSYAEFAHPAIATYSAVAAAGATFLFAAAMFGFVTQASNLVAERELKLRQAMATMGLMDSVYWLTWFVWEVSLSFIACILLVCFGMLFQFDFFLHNSFLVLFLMFFLFWVAMTSLAFFVSTFLRKSATANTVGFFLFIIGFVLQLVILFGFPYTQDFAAFYRVIFNLFPPNLLAIGLKYLGDATATSDDPGIQLSGIGECSPRNPDCVMTMAGIYVWLIALTAVYFLLAVYFDNVLPDVNGIRKPCYFFLLPSFWTGRAAGGSESRGACGCLSSANLPELDPRDRPDDADVIEEEERVKAAAAAAGAAGAGLDESAVAVSVRGLVKTFPGRTEVKCCQCKTTPAFQAVKGSWFAVEKDKLFCLLGPNGAGKSTTIHCLTGIIPTTAGEALVYGASIRDSGSMASIRGIMGVCPQFDILWDRLSGAEHLYLFARIKGLHPRSIAKEVAALLDEVRLTDAQRMRTSGYSGGMKRRLSVAVALIGDPKVVYLDEPTTGMDPVSRRHVWDIIERAKRGRAIVLTTHSMEEADILGDRIAIMARGRLRCIGTSIHLKNRFGAGFVVTVGVQSSTGLSVPSALDLQAEQQMKSAAAEKAAAVKAFFRERLGVEPSDENKGYIKFLVPREKEAELTAFFKDLNDRRVELGVADTQLSLSTLEEVFLNIARQAELETAQAEGRFDTVTLDDGTAIEVPIGAELVSLPPTEEFPSGRLMDVSWQQDDTGTLRISRHSEPRAATPETAADAVAAECKAPKQAGWWSRIFGKK